MGFNTVRETIDALRLAPEVLAIAVRNLTPEQSKYQPAAGEWSVLEVVCHLRDVEELFHTRFCTLRDIDNAQVASADANAMARDRNYIGDDLQRALAQFAARRAAHIADLTALQPEQWERAGQHLTLGPITIMNSTLHAAWHDTNHLAQIARLLP